MVACESWLVLCLKHSYAQITDHSAINPVRLRHKNQALQNVLRKLSGNVATVDRLSCP